VELFEDEVESNAVCTLSDVEIPPKVLGVQLLIEFFTRSNFSMVDNKLKSRILSKNFEKL
jgi:hypothetical protein